MKKILLIDDDKLIRESLSSILGDQVKDSRIVTAGDGMQAAKILSSMPIDLMVTDLEMPVMDGFELLEHRKKFYPDIPAFVITGSYSGGVRQMLENLGVSECIEKPFSFRSLALKIASELEKTDVMYSE